MTSPVSKAMLLAAGEGNRLRPLTDELPKPMLEVAGKPLLQHNVEYLARFGVREIVINLHYRPKAVRDHFGDGARFGVNIVYSHERELMGTAGAVKRKAEFFDETFLVLYGDNLSSCDLPGLVQFHRDTGGLATVALFERDDVTQSGVAEIAEDRRIVEFIEKPSPGLVESHWISAGILVLEPAVVEFIPPGEPSDLGRDILPALLRSEEGVFGYCMGPDEGLWWIDTPADYERVRSGFSAP